jgi:aspartate carbamoyltransferase regulatory subunit
MNQLPRSRNDAEIDLSFDEDDEQTIPCPYCKREIHEDAPRCPYCERYISEEDAPRSRKPWWMLVGLLLCLYAIYRWIAG